MKKLSLMLVLALLSVWFPSVANSANGGTAADDNADDTDNNGGTDNNGDSDNDDHGNGGATSIGNWIGLRKKVAIL